MKPKLLFLLLLLLPALSFCQSIDNPSVGTAEEHLTTISKIEVTDHYTIVTFKHITPSAGSWVELNKSIYLQDADGEERYNYIKSENIPLRPLKKVSVADNEVLVFKVYFEKLKPGTKAINIIERALSPRELRNGAAFFNYYNVSLTQSNTGEALVDDLRSMPHAQRVIIDTAFNDSRPQSSFKNEMSAIGPMLNNVYTSVLGMQMKFYSDPANVDQMAKITKNYYDALIKAGFSADQAIKIITSKQLVSMDMGGK